MPGVGGCRREAIDCMPREELASSVSGLSCFFCVLLATKRSRRLSDRTYKGPVDGLGSVSDFSGSGEEVEGACDNTKNF